MILAVARGNRPEAGGRSKQPMHKHSHTYAQTARCCYLEALKIEAFATFDPSHDVQEVRREDKRHALPAHAEEGLPVTQDVPEVDVEQVS